MGRRPTNPNSIPRFRKRLRGKKVYYFYDHGCGADKKRREESLGSDYGLAIKRWAEIENSSKLPSVAIIMFSWVADQYMSQVAIKKARNTLADNRREIANLKAFFNDPPAPLESIQPVNVRQYLTWRTRENKGYVRANREKALLSHIWNFAREKGYTALPNPCIGIRGFRETGRDVYIEDSQYQAIWKHADVCLRDAMELAYLTGQRPSDVMGLSEMDIREGYIHFRQRKTGKKLQLFISDELLSLLERIRSRKREYKIYNTQLIVNQNGRTVGVGSMSRKWKKACDAAVISGLQFRDLRAKAGTDKAESAGDVRKAQEQLGHQSLVMTEHYIRNRKGAKITPTR